jgi:hypothetical protein
MVQLARLNLNGCGLKNITKEMFRGVTHLTVRTGWRTTKTGFLQFLSEFFKKILELLYNRGAIQLKKFSTTFFWK